MSMDQSSKMSFRPLSATLNCRWTVSVENWRHSTSAELIYVGCQPRWRESRSRQMWLSTLA